MENYEQKYKEIVERIKELHAAGNFLTKKQMEIILSELAESEDERISRTVYDILHLDNTEIRELLKSRNLTYTDIWTYLEKQKESLHISESCKENSDSLTYSSEDERVRKAIVSLVHENSYSYKSFAGVELCDMLSYLEKQKEQVTDESDKIAAAYQLGRSDERKQKEQKPAESDAIKGGDFISDGKRVFLVLANVKERNLGETGSAYCESLILGVDGVVYCDGDDFKKYKRATSDERAKFIHDLKVGVKLKEQPAEWSEEDEEYLNSIIESYKELLKDYSANHGVDYIPYNTPVVARTVVNDIKFLKSLRPQPKREDEPMEIKFAGKIYKVHGMKDMPGGVIGYIIEDEPGHYDCIINPDEVLGGGYGIKGCGSPYPTKDIAFSEQPAEWSEGDEKMLRDVCESLYAYQCYIRAGKMDKNAREILDDVDAEKTWLKSLKDRIKRATILKVPTSRPKTENETIDLIGYE